MSGKARKLAAAAKRVAARSRGVPFTCRRPASRLSRKLSRGPGTGRGNSIVRRARMTPMNESAFAAKHQPAPAWARSSPATTGPIARERLNWSEFRATALAMRSLGTRLVITAW